MSEEKKRILLMEDSDIFADILLNHFASSDYILERAANGFEGIKKIYSFLPHLVITDIEMPLLKGYQVTRLLKSRKNTKAIPVIMLTTLDQVKDQFWGNMSGADIFMEKSPDNFELLEESISDLLSASEGIDFTAITRESKKINDNAIIEIVNNLLDSKLFQTTIIGMLAKLANKVSSMDTVAQGILKLLQSVCETEIATMMIRGSNRILYTYTANLAGFTQNICDDFLSINNSDFNNLFPEFKSLQENKKEFFPFGKNEKKISSYVTIPFTIAGENFATLHIANTLNDYFTPPTMENIRVFADAASPIIANALSMHELAELQKNTRIAFARYVPADVMDEIISDTARKANVSENRNISILFSDIRDFTSISENQDAQGVVNLLNSYFSSMGCEIISENGYIDKFIGDAIMAVFGASQDSENSTVNAIRAGIKMLASLEKFNNAAEENKRNKIAIGIGINCGECILGNIGFQNKMDYTVIGDTVNLASRIESLTKSYRHPLIISEYVYETVKDKFLLRKIGNVNVKGKEKPVGLYSVYSGFNGMDNTVLRSGGTQDLPPVSALMINRETLINYNKGLQVFHLREWKLAIEYFTKALKAEGYDFLSRVYLENSKRFLTNPPPNDWDGVISTEKRS
ncbi:MAG: adenylate/guanylate cyclase domain-containing response regulator [Treponema sp.]|nr:adenylate/guanylate cyclase domain-containing response regulator [Treponema sp.]